MRKPVQAKQVILFLKRVLKRVTDELVPLAVLAVCCPQGGQSRVLGDGRCADRESIVDLEDLIEKRAHATMYPTLHPVMQYILEKLKQAIRRVLQFGDGRKAEMGESSYTRKS